ncbi:hypothetical protein [Solemya velum gill symbiont]|uniref:hypothetical protein n=1 Tax=Solemya velum gill symbiont TaxID=2340 RepID=UPI0009975DC2|nr:hypothetical protein [Solemya velum gill symbiont]OOY67274.1 hypothetical protein BOW06_07215 [Solemya velum gill symbiont]OOY94989.1 hypothetical protein BOW18_11115 [Solemya velum gill symbiont]
MKNLSIRECVLDEAEALASAFNGFIAQGDYSDRQKDDAQSILIACLSMSGEEIIEQFGTACTLTRDDMTTLIGLYVWMRKSETYH